MLIERFGEPIGHASAGEGVNDERNGRTKRGLTLGNRGFGPDGSCPRCGKMPEGIDEEHVCSVSEARNHVSKGEVEQTWEDLFMNSGHVSLDELSSWLAADPGVVERSLPSYLAIDKNGDVVEKFMASTSGRIGGHLPPELHEDDDDPPQTVRSPVSSHTNTLGSCVAACKAKHNDPKMVTFNPEDELREDELDQVTPPGGENVVKALKKQKSVKNPWATAWSMKNKGEF